MKSKPTQKAAKPPTLEELVANVNPRARAPRGFALWSETFQRMWLLAHQKKAPAAPYSVYLVRCGDGTLYCGISTDVARRVREHDAGSGAKYTRGRGPVALVATARGLTRSEALGLERRVKRERADRKADALREYDLERRRAKKR